MKREEILDLIDKTSQDDDAGFQKIISALLNGGFIRVMDLAHAFGTNFITIEGWASGKNAPHPVMRKHIFQWIREWKYLCTCPKKCDCENPPPKNWDGKSGAYHVSEMCPEHNLVPRPDSNCPLHSSR